MAYKLEVDHPDFPKGTEFDCDGILVKNGTTVEVTREMEELFLAKWGTPIKDIYGHGVIAKLTGTTELKKKDGGE
jgi:hypothetical protein